MTGQKSNQLYFIGALFIAFGAFIFFFNLTVLYKGLDAVEVRAAKKTSSLAQLRIENNETRGHETLSRIKIGDEIGILYIPKLKAEIPIYHGTRDNELSKGIGHVIGSAFPGENNNSVLTGHRDTVFRKLGEVGIGDLLEVEGRYEIYSYKVRKVRVVAADDLTIIVPKSKATLTISTCYPFTYIGAAKERYVLVADLISAKVKRA